MSLRDLARAYLEAEKRRLSGTGQYRVVRPGQSGSNPYFPWGSACPDAPSDPDTCRPPGQTGQVGQFGQVAGAMAAPRRAMVFPVPRPKLTGPTDRFCRCGLMATFAYPDSAGRDIWRCLECLDAYGRA